MSQRQNHFFILRIAFISALGGFLFGYDWVVIGGAKPFYEAYFNISSDPLLQGWAVSSALVGCILGTVLSGLLSSKYGRLRLLTVSSILFLISAIGTGVANHFNLFIFFRIFGGIGIGLASNLSPIYISEIAPAKIRGKLVSIYQMTIVMGILLAQICNWVIAEQIQLSIADSTNTISWNELFGWRYMFIAESVPALVFLILLFFVPESPRWLIKSGKTLQALKTLRNIGGVKYAETMLVEIKQSLQSAISQEKVTLPTINSKIVFIGIILAVFQQWCGINIIFLYADEVFSSAGYTISGMLFNVIITGAVNLIFTLIAMYLVDKIGRKPLLKMGAIGLMVSYAILGYMYYNEMTGIVMLVFILASIACYAVTLAPVTWVVLSEIFPNSIRGQAMAISTFALWIANTLLAFFFPFVNKAMGAHGSFFIFSLICFGGFLFIVKYVKETKGKTLEQIEAESS